MHLRLDQLTDDDVDHLGGLCNDAAGDDTLPAAWCSFFAEVAEGLRAEAAQRMIATAEARDPMALIWFGRLTSEHFGKWTPREG